MKASKCQANGSKMGPNRLKREGEEKAKSKSPDQTAVSLLNTKPFEIFLSTYARTFKAYNLHLEYSHPEVLEL